MQQWPGSIDQTRDFRPAGEEWPCYKTKRMPGELTVVSRPRILIVDDEVPIIRVVCRVLEGAGFEVSAADDGARAVQLLDQHKFDAVLTDIAMPGMNGIELLRAVRTKDLEVSVVLMTGNSDDEYAADAIRYGACEVLIKPISHEQLKTTMRRAVMLSELGRTKRDSLRVLGSNRPEAGDKAGLEVTLEKALGSMWMAYQPIVETATRAVFGYEALLRSGEPSLPHPGAVLDAAERLGRLNEVGRRVRALAPEPITRLPAPAVLFVNLHASDLNDEDLFATSVPLTLIASRVVLEITERASLEAVSAVSAKVARLRKLGFRVAIDDLGAGYAGLTAFAQLEPEFVKLDLSLVRDVHKSPVKRKLVQSMTTLCKDMGITVIAEGIEVTEERDVIVELGCDLLQGYLFAKPGRAFPEVTW